MHESRTYVLVAASTITTSGNAGGYITLPRPAIAATLFANITTGSGNLMWTTFSPFG